MTDEFTEKRIRKAWKSLRNWQGPWDPVNFGDMAAQIDGITLDVRVKRWMEPDGTTMAAAIANGVEVERQIIGSTLPN